MSFSLPSTPSLTFLGGFSADQVPLATPAGSSIQDVPGLSGTPSWHQPFAANQPTYQPAGLNGKPTLVFNGASYFDQGHQFDAALIGPAPNLKYTIFVVCQNTGDPTQSAFLFGKWDHTYTPTDPNGVHGGVGRGPRIAYGSPAGVGSPAQTGTPPCTLIGVSDKSDGSTTNAVWGTTPLQGAPHVLGMIYDGSQYPAGNGTLAAGNQQKITLRVDGAQESRQIIQDSTFSHSGDGTADNVSSHWVVGANTEQGVFSTVGTVCFHGNISALLVYQGVPTPADVAAVEAALGSAYGFPQLSYAWAYLPAGATVAANGQTYPVGALGAELMIRQGAQLTAAQVQSVEGLLN